MVATALLLLALSTGGGSDFNLTPGTAEAGDFPPGDVNCTNSVDTVDALALLRYTAGLEVTAPKGCPEIGSEVGLAIHGDIDCDLDIDTVDGLTLLRYAAGLVPELEECVLQGLLPTEIDGVTLRLFGADGADLIASDPAWNGIFKALGISADDVDVSLAYPPPNSTLVFQMTVMQTQEAPWAPRLGSYLTRLGTVAAGSIDVVDTVMDGKIVRRLTDTADPVAPSYYYAQGDLIFVIQSPDPETVEELIAGIPDTEDASAAGVVPAGAPPTGLALHVISKPQAPPCVAALNADSRLLAMTFDSMTAIPAAGAALTAVATLGEATATSASSIAPAQEVLYQATTWGAAGESLILSAATPWSDAGDGTASFPVRHCLTGTWRDSSRVLTIQQNFSGAVTAPITEGTLECGATGLAFSGDLEGNIIAGDDLLVCSPELCYDLDLLDRTTLDDFEATVHADGYTIDVTWHRRYYKPVVDQNDDYVECVPAVTISETFEVRRLTVGN